MDGSRTEEVPLFPFVLDSKISSNSALLERLLQYRRPSPSRVSNFPRENMKLLFVYSVVVMIS